ncbi:glycerate dehydrogenase [Thermosulfidibacter takaii ABI70S6]|uniref:Glycerate dehydrogenase n=1 Tax=Thermosulfidibacter takaii (strain DSM 17441 / JCM 13301 / NBRC 103674 / ABI70S6) TaxID=1298851 RepID=A0A0S3QSF6_THET7|nr:D-2-hydroxyacid dehydrogenase [Thermosulfidibacter takaii]BAT71275.1 glycerate dehydrogenase [Thermosulfidibacter takaii ABI70S6]
MKIVILDAATLGNDVDLSKIKAFGETVIYDITPHEKRIERIKDAEIVISNKVIIDKEVMDNCPTLKLVCVAATGYNNVDVDYAKEKGIAVTNVAGYSTNSVAQHTFAMLFYLLHQLKYYDDYVKSSGYSKSPIFTHFDRPFWELKGKTWGIIGLGTIGREVARLAESFGCKVVYYSTSGIERPEKYPRVSLEELLETSDIVSIHAPLNERTRGLIDYSKLSLMKPTAILLNLGRGGIVIEKDLARALDEGKLYAAGLDVLEKEPINPDNPLLKVKEPHRLLITPHIAWTSKEARQQLVDEIAANIEAFLKGEKRNRII